MHLQFERREHRVPPGERVELRAAVVNDDGRLDGLTYEVETASDPATDVRWAVSGPSRLEPGQHATIVVTLLLPAAASGHPPLTVRLTVADDGSRPATTAETTVTFGENKCAAFAAAPSLTLSPDGSVTGSLVLVNCGPLRISLTVSARFHDGSRLTIDRPAVTLAAGGDPISVTVTMRRPDGRPVAEHEEVHLELLSDRVVLASAQAVVRAALRPPPRRDAARRVIVAAAAAVLLLALAIPLVLGWLRGSSPADGGSDSADGAGDNGAGGAGGGDGGNGAGGGSDGSDGGDTAAALPDLVVSDITASGVTVANVGDGPAGSFVVDIGGVEFDSGGLDAGDSTQFDIDLCEGTVDVVADPADAVAEADETNNDASETIVC